MPIRDAARSKFQSTPACERATVPACLPPAHALKFQSTPACERATVDWRAVGNVVEQFQSTPACERATAFTPTISRDLAVSIHARV